MVFATFSILACNIPIVSSTKFNIYFSFIIFSSIFEVNNFIAAFNCASFFVKLYFGFALPLYESGTLSGIFLKIFVF
jgi:hypothetical protein